ncbi:hypothetical protein CC80DRAFT_431229 [Byssothecium circinans]|uniref:DUF6697 domain-containing protein n=1 Tax=Byssothecium circinans TaxID=147558 RepID=A0A6A5TCX3_9PLEO|nr:hypothetical protein CC80DRAFT_431467 [Byssothecium circinans]KAF1948606.1 hypothetical protein CC80DRAFT_431229 [Byssothecium circinans]
MIPPHVIVPPHLRNKNILVPPHLRNGNGLVHFRTIDWTGTNRHRSASATSSINSPLVTDGNVDDPDSTHISPKTFKAPAAPRTEITPPESPTIAAQNDAALAPIKTEEPSTLTLENWKPHFLTTLTPFDTTKIPSLETMTSFAPDVLRNFLGGSEWSPGLNFIEPTGPNLGYCILPNRCYYTLDVSIEPFAPQSAGEHGAKLVPFFNKQPEEAYPDLPFTSKTGSSTENVALFVLRPDPRYNNRKRYFYFGHYTQSRWSDKLDYERMRQCVPAHVREYWAGELTAVGRPEWLSAELLQHFFPKPVYEGRMPGVLDDEGGSVAGAEMEGREEGVKRDVRAFVEELRVWKKEFCMRTAMIGREFVLEAFDRADADDPPALRLYWEYLECVDWKHEFYQTLSTLQGRDPAYSKY